MVKNVFISDEETRVSNTVAGVTLVGTLFMLYVIMKPTDFYGYVINIGVALLVSGVVYLIAELVRNKPLKKS